MSRAAFFTSITSDDDLNDLGINDNTVFHNYSLEERPVDNGPFVILRWGEDAGLSWGSEKLRAPVQLVAWVHYPIKLTNDYGKLVNILDKMDDLIFDMRDVAGVDGYTLSFVKIGGRSADLLDDGFETIVKTASYEVHSRRS